MLSFIFSLASALTAISAANSSEDQLLRDETSFIEKNHKHHGHKKNKHHASKKQHKKVITKVAHNSDIESEAPSTQKSEVNASGDVTAPPSEDAKVSAAPAPMQSEEDDDAQGDAAEIARERVTSR